MSGTTEPRTPHDPRPRRGFTLTEILVTIGIIVILIAITIPIVSKVQQSARVAGVQAQLSALQGAITRYQQDHNSLPGPLSNDDLTNTAKTALFVARTPRPTGFEIDVTDTQVTGSENLVLGLLGGLVAQGAGSPQPIAYDPTLVGNGPNSLNTGQQRKYPAYIEATNLSWRTDEQGDKTGQFKDGAGAATDTIIPEFVDTFSSPMPILYLRARKGAPAVDARRAEPTNNAVITDVPSPAGTLQRGHYDLSQIIAYTGPRPGGTGRSIGEGKDIPVGDYTGTVDPGNLPHGLRSVDLLKVMDKGNTQNYEFPYNSYIYLKNPSSSATDPQPRQKDGYILISAGVDRVYGTADDITSFGSVTE